MREKCFEEKIPKKLSDEELTELFRKYHNGSNTAREKIILHNIYLVLHEINTKFNADKYNKKDLISIGTIGLIKAIDNFDISKKKLFSDYAYKFIDDEILNFLHSIKKQNKTLKTINDRKINLEQDYEEKDQNETIKFLIELLPKKDNRILKFYFGFYDKAYTQNEIAKMFNLTLEKMQELIKKVTNELKDLFQELSTNQFHNLEETSMISFYELLSNLNVKKIDELLSLSLDEKTLIFLKKYLIDVKVTSLNSSLFKINTTKNICLDLIKYLLENSSIINTLTLKESMILLLRLGYIQETYFKITSIANFLEMDELEVIQILRNTIIKISQSLNNNQKPLKK